MMVMRLLDASGGEARLHDQDLLRLTPRQMMAFRRRIQIVFQNPYASLNPRRNIGRTLTEPMRIHRLGASEAERYERARRLLERVGLPRDSLERFPHEFSGGQRQRIAIARALAVEKYMADEVLVMREGEVVERGTPEAIFHSPQHDYTRKLLAAVPRGIEGRKFGDGART
jgi:peptide/nickel transport system ATP-binding protein